MSVIATATVTRPSTPARRTAEVITLRTPLSAAEKARLDAVLSFMTQVRLAHFAEVSSQTISRASLGYGVMDSSRAAIMTAIEQVEFLQQFGPEPANDQDEPPKVEIILDVLDAWWRKPGNEALVAAVLRGIESMPMSARARGLWGRLVERVGE